MRPWTGTMLPRVRRAQHAEQVTRLVRIRREDKLAFLSPSIVKSAFDGTLPASIARHLAPQKLHSHSFQSPARLITC
jgi:hypothetical protein